MKKIKLSMLEHKSAKHTCFSRVLDKKPIEYINETLADAIKKEKLL